ncbi:MAG: hypothetical protein IPL12_21100 [Bacteroidetes bacterium]|nr:hypothetical protein [Bacteroidota bacterium]MBK8345557.1 hypothetical protein [Bacteroidota bacterium]
MQSPSPRTRSFPIVPVIICINILPLIGVLYFNVSFFALFYLYWWETVIISIFQFVKMGKAELKSEPDPGFTVNGKTLTYQQVNSKIYMRLSYGIIRLLMLGFYLLFIIIFIGILTAIEEDPIAFANALLFLDPWVLLSFLGFFFTHLAEYVLWIRDKEYKTTSLRDLGNIFDSRVVVIHVVIVLGTFASMFAGEKLFPDVKNIGSIAYMCLFVLLKIGVDVYAYSKNMKRTHAINDLSGNFILKK